MSSSKEKTENISRFWVSTFPLFSATLFISPTKPSKEDSEAIHQITIFSSTGKKINEATISCAVNRPAVIELDYLLGNCELNYGLKHCQLEVRSPENFKHSCRLNSENGACMISSVVSLDVQKSTFFPLRFSSKNLSVLVVSNFSDEHSVCECKFYCGELCESLEIDVAPRCTRLIPIEVEFAQSLDKAGFSQGYLKLVSKSGNSLGVQTFERLKLADEKEIYFTVNR